MQLRIVILRILYAEVEYLFSSGESWTVDWLTDWLTMKGAIMTEQQRANDT